jgi:hypothetical protein
MYDAIRPAENQIPRKIGGADRKKWGRRGRGLDKDTGSGE